MSCRVFRAALLEFILGERLPRARGIYDVELYLNMTLIITGQGVAAFVAHPLVSTSD